MEKNWHNLSIEQSLLDLKTTKRGLSSDEAKTRLKHLGPNELPTQKSYSKFSILFEQFKSPLIYILIFAGLVTLYLRDYIDTIVIFGAVAINTIIGFTQENKASQALSKLKTLVKPVAVVLRDNNQKQIKASHVVRGDIIFIKPGDKIQADGRLIYANNLRVNEAALTGEWVAASKHVKILDKKTPLADRDNMIFMGTIVEEGMGQALVVNTGIHTQLGKIATLVKETREERTPFQKRLARFAKFLGIFFGLMSLTIFITGIAVGRDLTLMFTTSVAIAVAAVPEGLPAAMTVILAVGMQRILKKKGLARTLLATETLGSTSVICTDKTGTLTQAKMVVTKVLTGSQELLQSGKKLSESGDFIGRQSHILALKIAALCNEAFIENPQVAMEKWVVRGRPTDKALLMASVQAGLDRLDLEKQSPRQKIWPFSMERKFIASLHKQDGQYYLYASGAPEKIIEHAVSYYDDGQEEALTPAKRSELKEKYENLTRDGLRVVAVAYRKLSDSLVKEVSSQKMLEELKLRDEFISEFTLVGFIALKDPIRSEAKEAIRLCRKAGMRVIIVTGDHRLTAQAVAKELKLPANRENIIEGTQLDEMSDEELAKRLRSIEIYARVEPKHKLRIIDAWQKLGEVVAMTGDGINDAPALKKADIGVALGSGTDVAKETSDLILLNDNFSIIVKAVEQGRVLLDNLKKVIVYLLADSFSEIILIGGSLLFNLPLPITAAQILWINLVDDSFPSLALAFEPQEKDIMTQKPQPKNAPLLDKEMKYIIFIVGLVTSFILFGLFLWLNKHTTNEAYIRTMIFAGLGIDSLFFVFSAKSLRQPIWKMNIFSNQYLIAAVLFGFILLGSAIYLPPLQKLLETVPLLKLTDIAIVFGIGLLNLIAIEAVKWFFIHRKKEKFLEKLITEPK